MNTSPETPPAVWKISSRFYSEETVTESPVPLQESTALHQKLEHVITPVSFFDESSMGIFKLSELSDELHVAFPTDGKLDYKPSRLDDNTGISQRFADTNTPTVHPAVTEKTQAAAKPTPAPRKDLSNCLQQFSGDALSQSDLIQFSQQSTKSPTHSCENTRLNINSVSSSPAPSHCISGILVEVKDSLQMGDFRKSNSDISSGGKSKESTYVVDSGSRHSYQESIHDVENNSLAAYICDNRPPSVTFTASSNHPASFLSNTSLGEQSARSQTGLSEVSFTSPEVTLTEKKFPVNLPDTMSVVLEPDNMQVQPVTPPLTNVSPLSSRADPSTSQVQVTSSGGEGDQINSSAASISSIAESTIQEDTTLVNKSNELPESRTSTSNHSDDGHTDLSHCGSQLSVDSIVQKTTSSMENMREAVASEGLHTGQGSPVESTSQSTTVPSFTVHPAFFDSVNAQIREREEEHKAYPVSPISVNEGRAFEPSSFQNETNEQPVKKNELALSLPGSDSDCESMVSELSESCRPQTTKTFLEAFRSSDREKMMEALQRRSASNSATTTNRSENSNQVLAANEHLMDSEPSVHAVEDNAVTFSKEIEEPAARPKDRQRSKIPLRIRTVQSAVSNRVRGRSLSYNSDERRPATEKTTDYKGDVSISAMKQAKDSFFDVTVPPIHVSSADSSHTKGLSLFDLSLTKQKDTFFDATAVESSASALSETVNNASHDSNTSLDSEAAGASDRPCDDINSHHDVGRDHVGPSEHTETAVTVTPLTSSLEWKGVANAGEPLASSSKLTCIPGSQSDLVTVTPLQDTHLASINKSDSPSSEKSTDQTHTELLPIKVQIQAKQHGSSGTLDAISTIPSVAFPTHRTLTLSDKSTEYPHLNKDIIQQQESTTSYTERSDNDRNSSEVSLPIVRGSQQGDLDDENVQNGTMSSHVDLPLPIGGPPPSTHSIEDWLKQIQKERAQGTKSPAEPGDDQTLHTLIGTGGDSTHVVSPMNFTKNYSKSMLTLNAGDETTLCGTFVGRPSLDVTLKLNNASSSNDKQAGANVDLASISLDVPTSIDIPGVCVVNMCKEVILPIHNCTERWLQVKLSSKSTVNGEEASSDVLYFTRHRILKPNATENAVLKFTPRTAGEHVFQISLIASRVSDNSGQADKTFTCAVIITGKAELPTIEIPGNEDNILDFGALPYGCSRQVPLPIVNKGTGEIRLTVRILSHLTDRGHFVFTKNRFAVKNDVQLADKHTVQLTLPGADDKLDSQSEPAILYILYEAPRRQGVESSPENIEGRLLINLSSALTAEPIKTVRMICTTGNATIQIPSKFHVMSVEAKPGSLSTRDISVRNGGDIPIHISCEAKNSKYFFVRPPNLHLRPSETSQITLTFDSKGLNENGQSQVESPIIFAIEPNGREFSIDVTGRLSVLSAIPPHLAASQSSKFVGRTKLHCSELAVKFGGVAVNAFKTVTIKLQSLYEGDERLYLDISDPNFKLIKYIAGQEEVGRSRELLLTHGEKYPITVIFTPRKIGLYQSRLKVFCPNKRATIRIPIYGYAGTSNVQPNLRELNANTYELSAGLLAESQRNILCQFTLHNRGDKIAYTRLEPFTDASCATPFSDRVILQPEEIIIAPNKQQRVNLCMKVTDRERVLCSRSRCTISAVSVISTDEVLRQHLIESELKSSSGDPTVRKFLKCFKSTLDCEFRIPRDGSSIKLFKSSLRRFTVNIVGENVDGFFAVPSSISPVPHVSSNTINSQTNTRTADGHNSAVQGNTSSLIAICDPSKNNSTSSVMKKEFFIQGATAGQKAGCTMELKSLVHDEVVLWTLIPSPKVFHKATGEVELKPISNPGKVFQASRMDGGLSAQEKTILDLSICTEKSGMYLQVFDVHAMTLNDSQTAQIQVIAEVLPLPANSTSSAFTLDGVFMPQRKVNFLVEKPGLEQTVKVVIHNRKSQSVKVNIGRVNLPFICKAKLVTIKEKHMVNLPITFCPQVCGEFADNLVVQAEEIKIEISLVGVCKG